MQAKGRNARGEKRGRKATATSTIKIEIIRKIKGARNVTGEVEGGPKRQGAGSYQSKVGYAGSN